MPGTSPTTSWLGPADPRHVWEALEAGLGTRHPAMPMGMHTLVGPGWSHPPGGNAAAHHRPGGHRTPHSLIMDEATSALDDVTQRAITASIDRLHLTRLVVAHRLSTIRNADRILVLVDGRLVQEGNFDLLVGQPGVFRELVHRQVV